MHNKKQSLSDVKHNNLFKTDFQNNTFRNKIHTTFPIGYQMDFLAIKNDNKLSIFCSYLHRYRGFLNSYQSPLCLRKFGELKKVHHKRRCRERQKVNQKLHCRLSVQEVVCQELFWLKEVGMENPDLEVLKALFRERN